MLRSWETTLIDPKGVAMIVVRCETGEDGRVVGDSLVGAKLNRPGFLGGSNR